MHQELTSILAYVCRSDAVIDPWISQLWDKILQLFPLPSGKNIIPAEVRYFLCYTQMTALL